MSPEARRLLETDWPELARRLRALLLRKGIAPSRVDDVVQETALRLVQMGDAVDRSRSTWPLAVTIALNLLRDEFRSASRCELSYEIPESAGTHDVESSGIARAELAEVMRAMVHLTQAQRAVLLGEIGDAGGASGSTAADKMLRLRARKKLRTMIERLSAGVLLRSRRLVGFLESVFSTEGLTRMTTCIACMFVGFAATIALPVASGVSKAVAAPAAGGATTIQPSTHAPRLHPPAHIRKTASATVALETRTQKRGTDRPAVSGESLPTPGLPPTPQLPIDDPPVPDPGRIPVPTAPGPDQLPELPLPSLPLPDLPGFPGR